MPHILVVDDHPAVRTTLEYLLADAGHRVSLASEGQSALALAATHKPDLVLLDLEMPGLHGIQVCQALKQDPALAGIPVIMMTGRPTAAAVKSGLAAGAVRVFGKPFANDELLVSIRQHVPRKTACRAVAPLSRIGHRSVKRAGAGAFRSGCLGRQRFRSGAGAA